MYLLQGCASLLAATAYAHLTDASPLIGRQRGSNHACGTAASIAAKQTSTGSRVSIPASDAYECLESVPNYVEPALEFMYALKPYLEFQSDKNWRKDPPEGFLFPPVDLDAGVDKIIAKLQAGGYDSEYDFQVAVSALFVSAQDGHLYVDKDLMSVFSFQRTAPNLASVSVDGIQIPHIYAINDLFYVDRSGEALPQKSYVPSPVTQIDDVDVVSFILTQSLVERSQDPDACWNAVTYDLANTLFSGTTFQYPTFFPGDTTTLTFANGTSHEYPNIARVDPSALEGVMDGEDMYKLHCTPRSSEKRDLTATHRTSPQKRGTTTARLEGYPAAVIAHSQGSVSGYYLSASGLTDVAVLAIYSFDGEDAKGATPYMEEFQTVVQRFLDASVKAGKKKLVIDLQSNGGGFIDLGTDTFAQLFPSIKPLTKTNMRDSVGMYLAAQAAWEEVAAADAASYANTLDWNSPFAYQSVVTPENKNFNDFSSFYGPHANYEAEFTNYFMDNYSDPTISDRHGDGITVTGTGNRMGFKQPFAPENIIMLHDGICASTCTVFSEMLKNHAGVQSIAIGGRPQEGPMQGVGGIKGAQLFSFKDVIGPQLLKLFNSEYNMEAHLAQNTIWENFTDLPILTSTSAVNGRNHFRIGDTTETPLQYVYEASDCRIWYTQEMMYDPVSLWERVATMAFRNRTGTQINSPYCVAYSTGHATSIGGGWKQGTLGPQNPPENARMTIDGWKLDSDTIDKHYVDNLSKEKGHTLSSTDDDVEENKQISDVINYAALDSLKSACNGYHGEAWFVKLMCSALSHHS